MRSGRPEKPINWILVDNLLEAGCSGTEIAPHFDMHYDTFYNRVADKYGMTFTEYAGIKRQKGESVLRAVQYAKATGESTKGDNTLLIWLGKQRLGQKENANEFHVNLGLEGKFEKVMEQLGNLQSTRKKADNIKSIDAKS